MPLFFRLLIGFLPALIVGIVMIPEISITPVLLGKEGVNNITIKTNIKAAHPDEETRKDPDIVMPVCKLGCDELFELPETPRPSTCPLPSEIDKLRKNTFASVVDNILKNNNSKTLPNSSLHAADHRSQNAESYPGVKIDRGEPVSFGY